ncbi:DUF4365 domain-containing protein [Actinomadura violacea]|uniref:DUF4365 domain-containing protein n=1 Tax=Actinomadura violacea TaxID=2819934 RepID=A0ABS3S0Y8_9ACTN|nr:DUF4365 domain-containing protein [Actinomadura violacea]MBO2462680.1 DUF4365 domain-containing protein [Actinomadura violacea]
MALDHNNHQGKFGEAFVRTVAAASGLLISQPDPDYDGVDFSFKYPGARGTEYLPQIDVQVKSWRDPAGTGDTWDYSMKARHFNQLAGAFDIPRFLFLVVVPADVRAYTQADDQCLRVYQACYWASFSGVQPAWEVPRDQKVDVEVPKKNLVTADSLLELMIKPVASLEAS